MKNRIDQYLEKHFGEAKQLHQRLREHSTSFNAFVRAEMAAGRL